MDFGDLIEIVLSVFFDFGFDWYRFYACSLLTIAVIALIQWQVSNNTLATCLSVPTAIGGFGWGIAWEWRSRH